MDNLETQTYEVFENDTVKYVQYQRAIYEALQHREDLVTLCVVGAGRGPLVAAALKAAKEANRMVKVLVVEKNPNAIVTLRNRLRNVQAGTEWRDCDVSIYHTDMRNWTPPCSVDLVISELLGSFGDNEGSPECLDCLPRILRPGGVSIPRNSVSYVAPVLSQKCWVLAVTVEKKPECPYVVKMHNATVLASPQQCFSFFHPSGLSDHRRYTVSYRQKMLFTLETSSPVHGFIGYFESELFGSISLSILPSTHTPEMCSWFPIFFPLKSPLFIRHECVIEVWRCCDDRKLWYEWQVSEWAADHLVQTSGIHNSGGGVYWIGK
jgi:protein arginine N-methyltransferase 5